MRLTCPNCKAQYEIDGSVIPEAGRDVQCSACGNTWYQYPANVEIEMRSNDLEDELEDSPEPRVAAPNTERAPPRIDQSVLDVLREEAEREVSERRRGAGSGLEMQGDLGLVTRPAAGGASVMTPRPAAHGANAVDTEDETEKSPRPGNRRNLLPDIEELSSTLQPGGEPRRKGNADSALPPTEQDDRRGFRQGLSLVLLVAIVLVGLYALAPLIAQNIPALAEPMAGYVALVDNLRTGLAESLRGLIARLSGNG